MNKITLGVLFGGVSSEHDISTVSAKGDRKSTRLNSSHNRESRMPSSA